MRNEIAASLRFDDVLWRAKKKDFRVVILSINRGTEWKRRDGWKREWRDEKCLGPVSTAGEHPWLQTHDDRTSKARRHPSTLPARNIAGLRSQPSSQHIQSLSVSKGNTRPSGGSWRWEHMCGAWAALRVAAASYCHRFDLGFLQVEKEK